MARSHNTQRLFYQHNYPEIATVLEIAARKETSRFGSRLWERRPTDRDFGDIRLGLGSRPSTVIYQLPQTGASDDNPLWKDALKLAEDSRLLSNAVVTLPLRPYAEPNSFEVKVPARHSVGVFGKNPVNAADFARAVLTHFGLPLGAGRAPVRRRPPARAEQLAVGRVAPALRDAQHRHRGRRGHGQAAPTRSALLLGGEGQNRRVLEAHQRNSINARCACASEDDGRRRTAATWSCVPADRGGPAGRGPRRFAAQGRGPEQPWSPPSIRPARSWARRSSS
jgi:hypothetical protein